MNLYPAAKVAIGPTIKDGFYYDIEFPETVSEEILPALEKEMRRIAKRSIPLRRERVGVADAIKLFRERNDPYKVEILEASATRPSTCTGRTITSICAAARTSPTRAF